MLRTLQLDWQTSWMRLVECRLEVVTEKLLDAGGLGSLPYLRALEAACRACDPAPDALMGLAGGHVFKQPLILAPCPANVEAARLVIPEAFP